MDGVNTLFFPDFSGIFDESIRTGKKSLFIKYSNKCYVVHEMVIACFIFNICIFDELHFEY